MVSDKQLCSFMMAMLFVVAKFVAIAELFAENSSIKDSAMHITFFTTVLAFCLTFILFLPFVTSFIESLTKI